jgi:hypothetical protein
MQLRHQVKRHQKELVDFKNMILSRQKGNTTAGRQDIIKRKSLITANKTDHQQNERLKKHKETKQLVRTNIVNFEQDIYARFSLRQFAKFAVNVIIQTSVPN